MSFWEQNVSIGWVVAICLGAGIIVFWIAATYFQLRLKSEVSRMEADVSRQLSEQMRSWEERRLASERANLEKTLRVEYDLRQKEWKSEYAAYIRQDAINRSKSVIAGRVAENVAPFLPSFPFNPKDARFLGNPVDFIVFHGLDSGDLEEIVFLEMKSQGARVTSRQKQIRDAIYGGRVSWQELRWEGTTLDEALPDELYDDIG